MTVLRRLSLMALACSMSVAGADAAQSPKELKQALKKKAAAQKRAEEAKKAAAAPKASGPAYSGKANPATVAPQKPALIGGKADATAVAQFIDEQVNAKISTAKATTAPICSDSEFVRRVYLDIGGVIPTAAQAREFIDSQDANKRAQLINSLLASPRYAQHMTDVWDNLIIKKTSDNRKTNFAPFTKWLNQQFATNKPWNSLVAEVLTASGSIEKSPATGFFFSNTSVDKMADETSKLFLGQSLQCAQCHNHPFTDYQQTEYWALAQFFMKTITGNAKAGTGEVMESNRANRGKKNELPESAKIVPPQFLRGEVPKVTADDMTRPILAKWLASPTNPFLAKAMVNRTWAQFFGEGIVNPVDDMRPDNDASHPELLDKLAADFAANNFDIKHLVRSICNSQAYQRSSGGPLSEAEEALFARQTLKIMTPEQLFDSLGEATGLAAAAESRKVAGANKAPQAGARDQFATFFLSGSETANITEYEAGIPQALRLMNAKALNTVRAVQSLAKSGTAEKNIETLYLTTLSRRPSQAELEKLLAFVKTNGNTTETWSDILWVLINSSEFTMIR
jgi:hypothetical protein